RAAKNRVASSGSSHRMRPSGSVSRRSFGPEESTSFLTQEGSVMSDTLLEVTTPAAPSWRRAPRQPGCRLILATRPLLVKRDKDREPDEQGARNSGNHE